MIRAFVVSVFALLILGCGVLKRDDASVDSPALTDDTGEANLPPDPTFRADWSGRSLTLTITDGVGNYLLGMAETLPQNPDPWTGEDCYNGYTLGDGEVLLFCHDMDATGVQLSSVGRVDEIVEGSTTLFSEELEPGIAYFVMSEDGSSCWVWGADAASYYGELGCTVQP